MTARVLGLTGAVAATASAFALSGGWPASAQSGARTIALLAASGGHTKEIVVDRHGRANAVGDYFISTNARLLDATDKRPRGRMDAMETILSRTADAVSLTARLTDGTLQAYGERRHPGRTSELPVVGGTGAYAGVRGTVRLTEPAGGGPAVVTFELTP
jgi:hypothetical protein